MLDTLYARGPIPITPRSKTITIPAGGRSWESERSLRSAYDAAAVLTSFGHRARVIDTANLAFPQQMRGADVALLAFVNCHAEDGSLQGYLETCGVPYTGSGVLASALARHKPTAKTVAKAAGVPVLPDVRVAPTVNSDTAAHEVLTALGIPVIVKPETGTESVGITVARCQADLAACLATCSGSEEQLFAEPFIAGRAVAVGVLEIDGTPVPFPVVETAFQGEFYDHDAKWNPALRTYSCPAELPATVSSKLADAALRAHVALGCTGYSRSDFVVSDDGSIHWLEINVVPGLRRQATFVVGAETAGIRFEDIFDNLIQAAARR